MLKRKTFKQAVDALPPLKMLTSDDKLPYYFDLMWDIKYGYQLFEHLKMNNNPDVYQKLAEHGYDVKAIKKEVLK